METKTASAGETCSLNVTAGDILSVVQKNGEFVITLKDGTTTTVAVQGDTADTSFQLSSGELYTSQDMVAMFAMMGPEEIYSDSVEEATFTTAYEEEQATQKEEQAQENKPQQLDAPAEGEQDQAMMEQLAEELAEVETAAGDDGAGAAGSNGFGFNSSFSAQTIEQIDDIGAINRTQLQYGVGEQQDDTYALNNAEPVQPTLELLDPNTGLSLQGSYQVLEDGSIQLMLKATPDSPNGVMTITIVGIPSSWTVTGEGTYNAGTQTWSITVPKGTVFTGGPIVAPPADSDVDLTGLTIRVTEIDITTGLRGTAVTSAEVIVDAVADTPEVEGRDTTGLEDTAVAVDITGAPGDRDGSEVVQKYVITGVPEGFTLSAGTQTTPGTWELSPQQIQGLKLTAPHDFYGDVPLTVTIHTAETVTDRDFDLTNNTAEACDTLVVTFTPAADPPKVTVDLPDNSGIPGVEGMAAKVYEDNSVDVGFKAELSDKATPNEYMTVTVSGVDLTKLEPGSFSITGQGNAIWTRVPGSPDTNASFTIQLPPGVDYNGKMHFTPKANSDVDLSDIKVTAVAHEPASNTTANSNVEEFDVIVDAVADKPTLSVTSNAGVEGGKPADLIINTALSDNDGSETVVKYVINGLPAGFQLSAGTNIGNNVYELTPQQLQGLKVTPPANFYGQIQLNVTVHNKEIVTDKDFNLTNNTNSDAESICIKFIPSADPPKVHVDLPHGSDCGCPNSNGLVAKVYEDNSVNVKFSADRADGAAPTEYLTVTVSGVNLTKLEPGSFSITGQGNAIWTRVPGTADTNASFTIKLPAGADYDGSMKFTPKANSDVDLSDIKVTAVAHEPTSGTTANSNVEEFDVIVDAVADKPTIHATDVSVSDEGVVVPVKITAGLTDRDGSEEITHYQIKGVPNGFTFNHGTNMGNGVWQFTPAQINGLTIKPTAGYEGKINLQVHVFNFDDPTDKDFDTTNNRNSNSDTLTIEWADDEPVARNDDLGTYTSYAGQPIKYYQILSNDYLSTDGGNRITDAHFITGTVFTLNQYNAYVTNGIYGGPTLTTNKLSLTAFNAIIDQMAALGGKLESMVSVNSGAYAIFNFGTHVGIYTVATNWHVADALKFEYVLTDADGDSSTAIVTTKTYHSPLVFDLDGDGIELVGAENGVTFDMNNDGTADSTGWVGADDGLLALDVNGDGVINNQSELFGNSFGFENGFANLAQHDGNADGIIDSSDEIFARLVIWQDANQDGFSNASELITLADLKIASINLNALSSDYHINGNLVTDESTFTYTDGTTGTVVDAWFETGLADDATDNTQIGVNGRADTFAFEAGNTETEVVQNFNAEEGDVLDISALLDDGFDPLQDAIDEFVFATATDDGSTVLSVDATGSGNMEAAVQFAVLEGVTTSIDDLSARNAFMTA